MNKFNLRFLNFNNNFLEKIKKIFREDKNNFKKKIKK